MTLHPTILAMALAALLAACARSETPNEGASESQGESADTIREAHQHAHAPSPDRAAASSSQGPTVADIDRWQRGMAAERKALQEVAAKLAAAARNDEAARLEAVNASLEMNTLDAATAAAGLDGESYRRIRSTFSDAVSQLSPMEMEMDLRSTPGHMVEQFRQSREQSAAQLSAKLPPEVFAALKARAAELRQLDKELTLDRLRIANSVR